MQHTDFSLGQVSRLSGVQRRTLDYWARSGFLVPSIAVAQGKGSVRRYTFADVVAARTAHELRQGGVSLQGLRRVVRLLQAFERNDTANPLASRRLILCGHDVLWAQSDQELISMLDRPCQFAFTTVIDIWRIEVQMRSAVDALAA